MSTLINALEGIVPAEPGDETQTEIAQPDGGIVEAQLTQEITTLWSDHVRLSADRKLTSKELRQIKAALAERLSEMKALLSRPGRGGQWRGWLRDQKIPRSTADRLVARHAESLGVEGKNVPTGANTQEPPADSVEKIAKAVWQRHRKALAMEGAVIRFIVCIAEMSGVRHEKSADGLLILSAAAGASEGPQGEASDAHPASQACGEAPMADGETPAMITTIDQPVVGDESDSGVAAQPVA